MQRWEGFNKLMGTNDSLEEQIENILEIEMCGHRHDRNFDKEKMREHIERWLKEEDRL